MPLFRKNRDSKQTMPVQETPGLSPDVAYREYAKRIIALYGTEAYTWYPPLIQGRAHELPEDYLAISRLPVVEQEQRRGFTFLYHRRLMMTPRCFYILNPAYAIMPNDRQEEIGSRQRAQEAFDNEIESGLRPAVLDSIRLTMKEMDEKNLNANDLKELPAEYSDLVVLLFRVDMRDEETRKEIQQINLISSGRYREEPHGKDIEGPVLLPLSEEVIL